MTILEEINVKNVIIGKQFEENDNLNKFLEIVKEKKVNVKIIEKGNRVKIEKNIYFDVLWPSSDNAIFENAINNNSLVCKLNYKKFSMLFTGDIEEEAEKSICSLYEETNILKSTVFKVPHHGSKTSSTEAFLKKISPKIALIGVRSK